jgi:DNA-binding transcriptional ArsR family regulator
MSYEQQLKYERLKESMYNLMAEKPQTRRMLMDAFNLSKDQLSNHLQRLIDKGYIKLHKDKIEERRLKVIMVSQYYANPDMPFKLKTAEQLAKETVERFAGSGVKKRKREEDPPGVYRLLDYPLAAPKRTHKKTVVSIASGFNQLGW